MWPETMKRSPSRRADVRSAARSEPASGSEKPWQNTSRPGRDLGQQPLLELGRRVVEQRVADRLHRQQIAGQRQPVVAEALLGGDRQQRVERRARRAPRASAGRSSPPRPWPGSPVRESPSEGMPWKRFSSSPASRAASSTAKRSAPDVISLSETTFHLMLREVRTRGQPRRLRRFFFLLTGCAWRTGGATSTASGSAVLILRLVATDEHEAQPDDARRSRRS